jgi:hypothetical protein
MAVSAEAGGIVPVRKLLSKKIFFIEEDKNNEEGIFPTRKLFEKSKENN